MKKTTEEIIEYNHDTQKLLLCYMISCPTAFVRCQNILNTVYWNEKLRPAIRYILKFSSEYNKLPGPDQIQAKTGIDIPFIDNAALYEDWFLTIIEEFCRHKASEVLILDGPELIQQGKYAEIERRSKENMMISLQKDLGTDYFGDALERLNRMKDRTGMTTTGWKGIDDKLYGGLNRGELSFFVGGPGCVTGDTNVRVVKLTDISLDD